MTPIREFSGFDTETLRQEVVGSGQPAVLRGLVRSWPAVRVGSPASLVEYLRRFDNGSAVDALMTPPQIQGKVFYAAGMQGFNFIRNKLPIGQLAEQVLRYAAFEHAPAVAAQSAPIHDCLPGFCAENPLPIVADTVLPRIWLANAITTPTHLDEWNNIGCVVSGRRRFTLFPPEQIGNLYIGPLDFAPTGAPMSLVALDEPDFERFPKFRAALAAAVSAELGPGDAIYIPPLWWHHVESLERFNVLVNYWWHAAAGAAPSLAGDRGQAVGIAAGSQSGFDVLIHGLLNLRTLPPATRDAWRALFDHYVFGSAADVTGHIPLQRHGMLGNLSPAEVARLRSYLKERL